MRFKSLGSQRAVKTAQPNAQERSTEFRNNSCCQLCLQNICSRQHRRQRYVTLGATRTHEKREIQDVVLSGFILEIQTVYRERREQRSNVETLKVAEKE
ncbi:hypothetical protein DdX_15062 [Ditylenchus destructor]|uniref:Uncharacterized protein n=1 Tax=Ditylenchus destructor TaxID=166010 RepID=A0AAD4MS36_9BILA|nr:hypothetical protein DdX_15062 [Ditylenchus destructor]